MEYDKEQVKTEWQACQDFYKDQYNDCKEDWDFLHGDQWEANDVSKRRKTGRPCLVFNQLLPYVQQVVNDIRQANLAIRVSPVDDMADPDTAEIYQGIIRNIERQSDASTVYSTAALNAVGAGIGWLKVCVDYADEDTFDQEAYIERVIDYSSVYLDPSAERLDGSDAEYGFIRVDYKKDRFEELYPDAQPISFDETSMDDEVCVVEYYRRYYKDDTIYRIVLIDESEQIIKSKQKKALDEDGTVMYRELESRKVSVPYIKHCVLNGEDEPIEESEFPCKYIPLVPVVGEEVFIDNKREFHSLIRQGKDAMRMYNFWKSEHAAVMKMQSMAPTVGAVGSFASTPDKWATANTENHAFLEYDVVLDENGQRVEPPQRQAPVQGSPAMMQEAMGAREDIRLAIGMPQANMGERGNEVSGIAIRNRQIEGDNATFHFVDNLSCAIAQVGRILVDIIPRLYSERKITRILGEDGAEKNVPINQPFVMQDGVEVPVQSGQQYEGIYDLGAGKYDVVVDVGASYSSKRQETADKLIELVQAQPELMGVVGDLIFDALDVPMHNEIADRMRATMDPALLGEDPQANKLKAAAQAMAQLEDQLKDYQAALQDKQEDTQFDQQVELKKLEMQRAEIAIDAQKTAAEIEKMRAETKGFNMEAMAALSNAVAGLNEQVSDIGGAIEVILQSKEDEQYEQETSAPVENVDVSLEGVTNE
jgi:hypothetical protein